jgi:gliding motility-associated-like protein
MTFTDYICVQPDPLASFSVSPQSFSDVNQLVSFSNNSIGAVQYIWDFGDGSTSQNIDPAHLYSETESGILVTLIAISEFGCTDSIQVVIPYDEQEIFYVPNTFTPDGDNFNQIFTPVFYSGYDPYNFEMLIFNRWGEIIFETKNAEKGWDGSYGLGGVKVQDGIYTWKITYKNPETDERKIAFGHVTLLR